MTMHRDALQRLLAAILAQQPERADAGMALDEARLCRALSGKELLSEAEQHLLWTSSAARQRLTALHDTQRAAQYLAWRRAGIDTQIRCVHCTTASSTAVPLASQSLRLLNCGAKILPTSIALLNTTFLAWQC
jgi:hypothetical protein